MQFMHPHIFRADVRQVMLARAPEAWEAVLAAGGEPALPDGMPEALTGLACRRWVFESALRRTIAATENVTPYAGHADDVVIERGRVTGLVVDDARLDVDVVIDASGRSGRLAEQHRPSVEGGPCGLSYVSRMYQARPGVEGPGPIPLRAEHDGYLVIVFRQDAGTISTLIQRATADKALAGVKETAAFDAAMAAIPHTRPWTDPERYQPITPVLPGGGLTNTYRRQVDEEHPAIPGLFFIGDAVSTTNPAAGRGVGLGMRQVETLLSMLDGDTDTRDVAERFGAWCEEHIRPWYDDHVWWDHTQLRRWDGHDLDVEGQLSSDIICAAAQQDPSLMPTVGPFSGMLIGPQQLRTVQEQARAVLRTGWRPAFADGPTHDELVEVVTTANHEAVH